MLRTKLPGRNLLITTFVIFLIFLIIGGLIYGETPGKKDLAAATGQQEKGPGEKSIQKTKNEGGESKRESSQRSTESTGNSSGKGEGAESERENNTERTGTKRYELQSKDESRERHTESLSSGSGRRASSRNNTDGDSGVLVGVFEITAYDKDYECTGKRPGDKGYGITAIGAKAKVNHTIAADWDVLPAGTIVKIDGIDVYLTVEDRGSAVKGNTIDLFLETHQEAIKWGRQERKVWVIEWGDK